METQPLHFKLKKPFEEIADWFREVIAELPYQAFGADGSVRLKVYETFDGELSNGMDVITWEINAVYSQLGDGEQDFFVVKLRYITDRVSILEVRPMQPQLAPEYPEELKALVEHYGATPIDVASPKPLIAGKSGFLSEADPEMRRRDARICQLWFETTPRPTQAAIVETIGKEFGVELRISLARVKQILAHDPRFAPLADRKSSAGKKSNEV